VFGFIGFNVQIWTHTISGMLSLFKFKTFL